MMPTIPRTKRQPLPDVQPRGGGYKLDYPSAKPLHRMAQAQRGTFEILQKTSEDLARSAEIFYEADQNNKLTNAKRGYSNALYEFDKGLVVRTDHENFVKDFEKTEKGAYDTFVQRLGPKAKNAFDIYSQSTKEQIGLKTQVTMFKKIKDQGEADYISRRADRLAEYGGADTLRRMAILQEHDEDLAGMSGYMERKWLEDERINFKLDTEQAAMIQDANNSPFTFNAYDQKKYPLTEANTRARMQQAADTKAIALQNKLIRDEERKERQEEKARRLRHEKTFTALLAQAMRGEDIFNQVFMSVDDDNLTGKMAQVLLQTNLEGITDNRYLVNIHKRVLLGQGTLIGLLDEIATTSKLAVGDKQSMMDKVRTSFTSGDISKTPTYQDAQKFIEKHVRLKSTWSPEYNLKNEAAITAALDEFDRRVRDGENPTVVRNEVVDAYRPTEDTFAPLYGTTENPQHSYEETMKAFDRKEMDEELWIKEILNIANIAVEAGTTLQETELSDKLKRGYREKRKSK